MAYWTGGSDLHGHQITLQTTDIRHLSGGQVPKATLASDTGAASFGKLFLDALGRVNDLQHRAMSLEQQMVTNPDSVDIHDITIAIAEANLAISTAKAVVDGAIRAYQGIINVR